MKTRQIRAEERERPQTQPSSRPVATFLEQIYMTSGWSSVAPDLANTPFSTKPSSFTWLDSSLHSQLWPCRLTVGVRTVLQNRTSVLYIDDTMFSGPAEHEVSQEALVSTCIPEDRRLTPVKNRGPHISENSRVQSSRARQDLPLKVTGKLLHVIPSIMKKNVGQSIFRIQEYWSNPETGSHKQLPALSGVLSGKDCSRPRCGVGSLPLGP